MSETTDSRANEMHIRAKTMNPELRDRRVSPEISGLLEGFLRFHLDPNENRTFATIGRAICDAGVFLVMHPNGSLDGALSHFLPNDRAAHAELYDELPDEFDDPEAKRFALLLVSNRQNSGVKYEGLVNVLSEKNKRPPHIVATREPIHEHLDELEIIFTQKVIVGSIKREVRVTNSDILFKF